MFVARSHLLRTDGSKSRCSRYAHRAAIAGFVTLIITCAFAVAFAACVADSASIKESITVCAEVLTLAAGLATTSAEHIAFVLTQRVVISAMSLTESTAPFHCDIVAYVTLPPKLLANATWIDVPPRLASAHTPLAFPVVAKFIAHATRVEHKRVGCPSAMHELVHVTVIGAARTLLAVPWMAMLLARAAHIVMP